MFTKDLLEQDQSLRRVTMYMLSSDLRKLGSFVTIRSVDEFYSKLANAHYERIKYLPRSNLTIYRTQDIGLGYCDSMSLIRYREFVELGKFDKMIPIYLEYKHGNIFSIVKSTDINIEALLTDETYLFVHEDTKQIWNIKIGKPSNPNNLYLCNQWENVVGSISAVSTISGINRINFYEVRDENVI